MNRLANIDRRAEPKAWLDERARIGRERDARMACLEIAFHNGWLDLGQSGMLAFLLPNEPDYHLRLECLKLSASRGFSGEAELLARAAGFLEVVTRADND